MTRTGRLIGFIGFDGVAALDLFGALEAFSTAAGTERRYSCRIYGLSSRAFEAESGVLIKPHATLQHAPILDTLIIPGGFGLRDPVTNAHVVTWIRKHESQIRRICSVCTGIYGLAPTGLLDGRRVTTHWRFAGDIAAKFPNLTVDPDRIYIKDGKFYTSAGVTAAIDLALGLIEMDHGVRLALEVARELVVYLKRSGGQHRYSEPLQLQSHARNGVGDLLNWMSAHLSADLSIEALSERAHLSPRQLHRKFASAFGVTPAHVVDRLRLDAARDRLLDRRLSIKQIAKAVGYESADVFRRSFGRRFGVLPRDYRSRFGTQSRAGISD